MRGWRTGSRIRHTLARVPARPAVNGSVLRRQKAATNVARLLLCALTAGSPNPGPRNSGDGRSVAELAGGFVTMCSRSSRRGYGAIFLVGCLLRTRWGVGQQEGALWRGCFLISLVLSPLLAQSLSPSWRQEEKQRFREMNWEIRSPPKLTFTARIAESWFARKLANASIADPH